MEGGHPAWWLKVGVLGSFFPKKRLVPNHSFLEFVFCYWVMFFFHGFDPMVIYHVNHHHLGENIFCFTFSIRKKKIRKSKRLQGDSEPVEIVAANEANWSASGWWLKKRPDLFFFNWPDALKRIVTSNSEWVMGIAMAESRWVSLGFFLNSIKLYHHSYDWWRGPLCKHDVREFPNGDVLNGLGWIVPRKELIKK